MRISYNWLKRYVDVKMTPERLSRLLTMSGLSVESVETKANDSIFEIEVTSNRPDWLSVVGVAREVAALTGTKLNLPYNLEPGACTKRDMRYAVRGTIKVSVEDKKLCPRYTARIIEGVKVAESPKGLREKIESIGLRPVNNIVDITNFCLFEMGEPMHAFDLDKIADRQIIVRQAAKGEKIKTIDGAERALDEKALVIADARRPIAIAGIMGGSGAEVAPSTKNILLEAAIFDPVSVRRTSRSLGVTTESSYRFERRIDPAIVLAASNRAAAMILKDAGGVDRGLIDIGNKPAGPKTISLGYQRLDKTIGLQIARDLVKKILTSLGFRVIGSSRDGARLEVPSFRQDTNSEIDLIEEVGRVYGYDKIPMTLPKVPPDSSARAPDSRIVETRTRGILASSGLYEIVTYSLFGKKDLESANLPGEEVVNIENPLSQEQDSMRPSLIPGLLKAVVWNINRRADEIGLFEIGNIYLNESSRGFTEAKHLAIALAGPRYTFFDLKGIFETLAETLGAGETALRRADNPLFAGGSSAKICAKDGGGIGFIGEVAGDVLDNYDIKEKVFVLDISLDEIYRSFAPFKRYSAPPKYPGVTRDLSIIVDADIEYGRVADLIKSRGGAIIRDVRLIDRYAGRQIPDGKISFTYRIEYLDPSKTLEDSEVSVVHSKISAAVSTELGAKIR